MPTTTWTVNERDIEKRKREVQLNALYKQAYEGWKKAYEDSIIDGVGFMNFGTSPVKDSYWEVSRPYTTCTPYIWKGPIKSGKVFTAPVDGVYTMNIEPPKIQQHFSKDLLSKPLSTMVFRRFENLMPPGMDYYYLSDADILVKALLGKLEYATHGYKFARGQKIVNDSWTVNLKRSKLERDYMMEAFLKGFSGKDFENMTQQWGQKFESMKQHGSINQMQGIDVTDELNELHKVYSDALVLLKTNEERRLTDLNFYMEEYQKSRKQRSETEKKLKRLESKMKCDNCGSCDHDSEDEDEDEDEE